MGKRRKKRRAAVALQAPKKIVANLGPPPPLADFILRFKTGTKMVILHIPHKELDKVAYLLYTGLKKEGITCTIEEIKNELR